MMPTKEERQWRNDVIDTIDKIIEVRPHIHRIMLSAAWCNWKQPIFESFKWQPNDRKSSYQQVAYIKNEFGTFRFESMPEAPCYPPLYISTTATNNKGLYWLCKNFQHLRISSVELAIDFISDNPSSVSDIFYLLHHYTYFPRYSGCVEIIGGEFHGWQDSPHENRVFKSYRKASACEEKENDDNEKDNTDLEINKKRKKGNSAKIYERGPDKKQKKDEHGNPYWEYGDVDRVRLEVRLKNIGGNSKLKKLNINFLEMLLTNLRPKTTFPSLFRFACFTGKGFPKEYEEYYDKENNHISSFQELYIRYKKPSSRIKKAKHTQRLEEMIAEALRLYSKKLTEENWEAGFSPFARWRELYDMS